MHNLVRLFLVVLTILTLHEALAAKKKPLKKSTRKKPPTQEEKELASAYKDIGVTDNRPVYFETEPVPIPDGCQKIVLPKSEKSPTADGDYSLEMTICQADIGQPVDSFLTLKVLAIAGRHLSSKPVETRLWRATSADMHLFYHFHALGLTIGSLEAENDSLPLCVGDIFEVVRAYALFIINNRHYIESFFFVRKLPNQETAGFGMLSWSAPEGIQLKDVMEQYGIAPFLRHTFPHRQ